MGRIAPPRNMRVFIAAGHGGNDPGSLGGGVYERDEAIKLVNGAVQMLNAIVPVEHKIIQVPNELALTEGVKYINDNSVIPISEICLEIHYNNNVGIAGTGTETWYGYKPLAQTMQTEIVKVLGLTDRGIKDGNNLYFNKNTKPYSALIEMGFINNRNDLVAVRNKGVIAIVGAICKYLNISISSVVAPVTITDNYKTKYEELVAKIARTKLEIGWVLDGLK